jgi:hypothetical protein
MERPLHCICRILAAAALLTPLAVARPSSAGSQVPDPGPGTGTILAQANPADAAPAPPPPSNQPRIGPSVETRIEDLHRNLKITAAQEPQWRQFAQVMRDNAHALDAILQERSANINKMNAVDDLRSYEKLADAHADGLKKLVPAFEALYNTMSDEQKKNADVVFSNFERRPRHPRG